ncbi:MAG: hypothetical protein JWM59_1193 [Verrucomicrobiales bacterium]|nr:hypothetical protein [Verrucomicrobiales bacterium]
MMGRLRGHYLRMVGKPAACHPQSTQVFHDSESDIAYSCHPDDGLSQIVHPISIHSVSTENSSIRIWRENVRVVNPDDCDQLSSLTLDDHVHGGLRLEIGGRLVPHLGFFGPDDVCFGTWLAELGHVAKAFRAGTEGRHLFDEGEQGQPAFLFERHHDSAFLSIVGSMYGGEPDPDWQRAPFSPHEFLREQDRFRESFHAFLQAEAPHVADLWMREHAQAPFIKQDDRDHDANSRR